MSSALARSETGHEFGFSDHDFEQVRRLIYEHAGISLSAAKREMVYSRLSRRLRVHGLDTFQAYLRLLDAGDAAGELVVDELFQGGFVDAAVFERGDDSGVGACEHESVERRVKWSRCR